MSTGRMPGFVYSGVHKLFEIVEIHLFKWEFQDPKLEVSTIYKVLDKASVREYPNKIWSYSTVPPF